MPYGRSRSFAFSGLEGGTCRLPALPTRHLPDHLAVQPPHPRPPGRPIRRPVRRRLLRLAKRLLPRPPSAGYAWLRCPATGHLMTARSTAPRARRRARYPCRARVPTGSGEYLKVPSLPVLLSRRRVVPAVRPGNRRNPGRRPVAEATRTLDDRTGPGPDQPPHPDPDPRPEAQDPADHDIAPGCARGGDDRRAQFRSAVPRAGAAPGAAARPPARARAARPPGAVALHRTRGGLAPANPRLAHLPILLRARRPGGCGGRRGSA
jgi:hypothetical protein